MLKAQKKRQSVSSQRRKKRKRTDKCSFAETPLGYYMIHECPLEFELLKEIFGKVCIRNNVYIVESFAYSSDNPFFRTDTFRKALLDYKKYGCRTPNRILDDAERELEYIYRDIAKKHDVIETEILFL